MVILAILFFKYGFSGHISYQPKLLLNVPQEDFFGGLQKMLSEMQEVTELHPVPDAHVPVVKFKFNGVSVDLLYARLALWVIPEVSDLYFMQKQITLF